MKKKEITVIFKEPGLDPVEVTVPNELRQFQSMVGGYIETVPFTREILILCDEEGRIKMRTPNIMLRGDVIVGPVVFVGVDEDSFTDCPLNIREFYTQYDNLFREVPS